MTPAGIKLWQQRLAVTPDGDFGRVSWTALFRRLGASPVVAAELALAANVHMRAADIWTPLRLGHFLAQLGHESGGFKWMEELASGSAYEGRLDLGNIHAGDGRRFKGRGVLQLTGRANYRSYSQRLGVDFESHPEIVAMPSIGLLVACTYWTERGLNALADRDDLEGITRKVNGGLNGIADRRQRLRELKEMLP